MQDRNIKTPSQIALDLALKSVEYRMAKRAGRYHCVRAACLGRHDVLAGQFNRDRFVMRGGVKATAFRPAAVVDRTAAENFGEALDRDVVSRVDETVSQRRAGDMAPVKCRHRQPG